MAIKIPILTSFDPKGLKQANAQFANLQSSVGSLGRNFAALGAVVVGAGALIAKNVQSLARIEEINAQTAQTISTMGNAANITASEVEKLAGNLESMTAIEAESIQEGANLLLTFGNIRNELGAGNDIFTQTTKIMVDMGVALKKGPVDTATMLGKALNDPIQGLTALRRVGVSFTEQQIAQVKALQESGDLMGAQKLILEELQKQYGGSGAAYAKTFTGQLELMGHELGTIGEEATMAVMPALQMMVEELRELIPIIGPQLKAAIESVDWKALVTSVIDFTRYLVENGAEIVKGIAAFWAISTAIKTLNVAIGIGKVAIALYTWTVAQMATGMTLATVATNILSTALRLIPIVAVIGGLVALVDSFNKTKTAIEATAPALGEFETNLLALADQSKYLPIWSVFRMILLEILKATGAIDTFNKAYSNSAKHVVNTQAHLAMWGRANGLPSVPSIPTLPDAPVAPPIYGPSSRAAAAKAAAEAAAEAERQVLEKRKSAFESFNESVKSLFGQIKDSIMNSFSLPNLGNSVNAITRNMAKLLEKTKSFASNIAKLSGMGLNSTLLQQVIQAGPMAGSQLANAIVGGGSGFINQLNSAYNEFGNLAGGIAGIGTERAFANQGTVNNYSIEVTGGVATSADVGRAVVNAIKDFERQSGTAWRG
jgi:hypothetical protein